MYRLDCRIYDLPGRVTAYAEYYQGDGEREEIIMSAHIQADPAEFERVLPHERNLIMARRVWDEIAENCSACLF